MSIWDEVVGQEPTIEVLQRAVVDPASGTHAWLFTGPPGSGRSVAARAFAAALECPDGGCGVCRECRTAYDGTHADVDLVATEGLSIGVKQTRELVELAARRPSVGAWRVIVVEDADRLGESAGNALLKAIEEPVSRTVWMLCAPSIEDVLVTIRSRARHVRLRTPPPEAVADLLVRRDGITPVMALHAARAAQSHIGLARRLARDEGARIRRRDTLRLATAIHSAGEAVDAAADLVSIADEEKEKSLTERNAQERARLLETLGADPGARTQPPHVRAQLSALEREQKTRATRLGRDVIDRSLTDLLSLYRDALVRHTGSGLALINEDNAGLVDELARAWSPEGLLGCMDAIRAARERIEANGAPLLMLEAMALQLRLPG
ncbi:MAG: DNA polymerase III subunit delta' [Nostocoides sp.]